MAKKKKATTPRAFLPSAVAAVFRQAEELVDRRQYTAALALLAEIDRQYPSNFQVLQLLADAAFQARRYPKFLDVTERLVALAPDDPDFAIQRVFANSSCGFIFLARRSYQEYERRWPDRLPADRASELHSELEKGVTTAIDQLISRGYATAEDAPELLVRHEQVQVWLLREKYAECRRVGAQLLARWPNFSPGWNNVAESWYREGNLAQAIAAIRQGLAAAPQDAFGQANLVCFLVYAGQMDEARADAERLKTLAAQHPDDRLKASEALLFVDDDAGVAKVWADAEQVGFQLAEEKLAWLHHFAAMAEWHTGNERRARELWDKCLKVHPPFEPAKDALADMAVPAFTRNGPYVTNWETILGPGTVKALTPLLDNASPVATASQVRAEIRLVLQSHAHAATAVGVVFAKSDARSRNAALRLCGAARTPELLARLRDCALSQHGSDRLRIQAAFALATAGELPKGEARLWLDGEWKTRRFWTGEVTLVPVEKPLPRNVMDLMQACYAANESGDGVRGEQLAREALKFDPTVLALQHAIINSLRLQNRLQEAHRLLVNLHEQHPDYLFAAVEMARHYIYLREYARAKKLYEPFFSRPILHIGEFRMLSLVQFELATDLNDAETGRFVAAQLEAVWPKDLALKHMWKALRME